MLQSIAQWFAGSNALSILQCNWPSRLATYTYDSVGNCKTAMQPHPPPPSRSVAGDDVSCGGATEGDGQLWLRKLKAALITL
jgi:hypothetical protein